MEKVALLGTTLRWFDSLEAVNVWCGHVDRTGVGASETLCSMKFGTNFQSAEQAVELF